MRVRPVVVCLIGALPALAADLMLPVGGKVSIDLQFSDAVFSNTMSIVAPGGAAIAVNSAGTPLNGCKVVAGVAPLPGVVLMSERNSQHGCRVELDADPATPGIQPFPAGTVLRFAMCSRVSPISVGCDFVWSSNPALNNGAAPYSLEADPTLDHLQITPVHNVDYPGRIFQLGWEDKPSNAPSDRDFNDLVAMLRIDLDSDGDGLWDDWEQFGVDFDGDGIIDVNLPALGASKLKKDVFVRLDYMDCSVPGGDCAAGDLHSHQPKAAAIAAVVAAFAAAPVSNPDGTTGINLHIEMGTALRHQSTLVIPNTCLTSGVPMGNFDVEKAASFGINNPKRFTHHYGIFAHLQDSSGRTGCAERPGNDLLVTLGGLPGAGDRDGDGTNDASVGTVMEQAGSFMHELGHNLGLKHGGGDDVNYKPNYLSVMSYSFQLGGIPLGGAFAPARLDYSKAVLPASGSLDESSLNETGGIGLPIGAPEHTTWMCPGFTSMSGPAAGPINWNCNASATDSGLSQDINGDRVCIRPGANGTLNSPLVPDDILFLGAFIHDGPNRICNSAAAGDDEALRPVGNIQPRLLTGFDDWSNLIYRFQESPFFDDGLRPPSPLLVELDTATILQRTAADPAVWVIPTAPIAVQTGKQVSFRFSLHNNTATPASGVQLTDVFPAGLSFVSCYAPGGTCGGSGASRNVQYSSIAGGAEANITMVATLSCNVAGGTVITNTGTVTSNSADSDLSNNNGSFTILASNPAPVISDPAVDHPVLSPADGRMVLVTVDYGATDNCSVGGCTLSVTSNATPHIGPPDFTVVDSHHVSLKSQNNGSGAARVYTIRVTCTDNTGKQSNKHVTVTVP